MSQNRDEVVEATKLFVDQIRIRPMNVIANLNCLLEEHGIELCFRQCRVQTQAAQSVFDWQPPEEMREPA